MLCIYMGFDLRVLLVLLPGSVWLVVALCFCCVWPRYVGCLHVGMLVHIVGSWHAVGLFAGFGLLAVCVL